MTLDDAIRIEDALECQRNGLTREQFIACVKPAYRAVNAQAWDDAMAYIYNCGNSRKALNHIEKKKQAAAAAFFPA
jgi:hypothetical protein